MPPFPENNPILSIKLFPPIFTFFPPLDDLLPGRI